MGVKRYLGRSLNSLLRRWDYEVTRSSGLQELRAQLQESRMLSLYSQFIKNGDLCFDIGANVGSRIGIFRKLGASVVAVEPQHTCVEELTKKYGADSKVMIIGKATGAHEGQITIGICAKDNEKSSCCGEWMSISQHGSLKGYAWDGSEKVPMTTLDRLIEEFGVPAFCKIDTEGFEWEVIKGLSRPIKALSLEFHIEYLAPAVNSIHRLVGLGLTRFNYSVGESMELALPGWATANEISHLLETFPDKFTFGDVYAMA